MRHSFILIYRPDVRYIVVNIMIRRDYERILHLVNQSGQIS